MDCLSCQAPLEDDDITGISEGVCEYCARTGHDKRNPLNPLAPEGKVYMCMACGKRSQDKYGYKKLSYGWDESCMLNCALMDESDLKPWL